jgi:hypothetical protein
LVAQEVVGWTRFFCNSNLNYKICPEGSQNPAWPISWQGAGCLKGVLLWPLYNSLITIHLASPWSWNSPQLLAKRQDNSDITCFQILVWLADYHSGSSYIMCYWIWLLYFVEDLILVCPGRLQSLVIFTKRLDTI